LETKGAYRKRSRHARASNGYNTLAEQRYGEQGHTKTTIFTKNTPITHPVRTISLANSFTTGISFSNALDTDSAGISANLSSSNPTTSGVRFLDS
jgi:AICAR transformylase/IMP cyclohydrolase PurH